MFVLKTLLLLLVCLGAVYFDLRHRRIPNLLSITALCSALILRIPGGWESLAWGLTSGVLAFSFGFIFFLLGGLGGGDVKLMAGLAAFLEPAGLLVALVVMALVGGVMAFGSVVRAQRLRTTGTNLAIFFATFGKRSFSGWKGDSPMVSLTNKGSGVVTNPYAVAICIGAFAGWIAPHLG